MWNGFLELVIPWCPFLKGLKDYKPSQTTKTVLVLVGIVSLIGCEVAYTKYKPTRESFSTFETALKKPVLTEKAKQSIGIEIHNYEQICGVVDGWLSTDGKFYPCEYGEHARLGYAMKIIKGRTDVDWENIMEKAGWMKIQKGIAYLYDKFTAKQRDLVFDWYVEKGKEPPYWIDEKEWETNA